MSTCRHCGHPTPPNPKLPYICPCGRSGNYEKSDVVTARKIALANAGGAAFPDPGRAQSAKQREKLTEAGMTLRDYFAAKAMTALLEKTVDNAAQSREDLGKFMATVSFAAFAMADAMLVAREA